MASAQNIAWFSEIHKEDYPFVGDKGVSLGSLVRAGQNVIPGFVITASALQEFLTENNIQRKISHLISTSNIPSHDSSSQLSLNIKKLIMNSNFPKTLVNQIIASYHGLDKNFTNPLVSLELSQISKKTGVNYIKDGIGDNLVLLENIKKAWACLYDTKSILQRYNHKESHMDTKAAVIIQKKVPFDHAGFLHTIDVKNNSSSKMIVEASNEIYEISKKNLMILSRNFDKTQKLSDYLLGKLAETGRKIEKENYFPQQIEWIIKDGKIFIKNIKIANILHAEKIGRGYIQKNFYRN